MNTREVISGVFPAGSGGLLCDGLPSCGRELCGSGFSALLAAELAQCHCCRVLPCIRVFERPTVHVLADGLLDNAKGAYGKATVHA
jgi:hypothetical protein